MFFKTLKHDLANSFKDYSTLYLAMIILSIVTPLSFKMNNEFFAGILMFSLAVIFVVGFIITVTNSIGFLRRRLFEEGAYFNLTLPVSLDTTLMSKIVTVAIWQFVTYVIIMISIGLFAITFDTRLLNELGGIIGQVVRYLSGIEWWQFVLGFLHMFVGLFAFTAMVLFALAFVNSSFVRRTNYIVAVLIFFAIAYIDGWITYILDKVIFVDETRVVVDQVRWFVQFADPISGIISVAIEIFMFILIYAGARYLIDRKLEI